MSHQIEVTRVIAATPELLYALVSDLPRMGEWSPENDGGKWLKGATGAAVGVKFEGANHHGKKKWKTMSVVTRADAGKEFAFDVKAAGANVAAWGFAFEPSDGGTKVTHYWDDHRNAVIAKITGMVIGVPDRAEHNRMNMEQTLERLAATL